MIIVYAENIYNIEISKFYNVTNLMHCVKKCNNKPDQSKEQRQTRLTPSTQS